MKERIMRIFLCIILLSGSEVYAETTIEETYNYYGITAGPDTDLIAELDSKSPVYVNDQIYHAYTSTNIAWTFGWSYEKEECHITWVNTIVEIIYTLPEVQYGELEPGLRSIWDRWYPALQKHERHHGELAIKTARELEASIMQLTHFSNCKELEDYANQTGHNAIDTLEKRHHDYDEQTNHGEEEGASLFSYF
jgi:predicted secreted Zn-dependent protease